MSPSLPLSHNVHLGWNTVIQLITLQIALSSSMYTLDGTLSFNLSRCRLRYHHQWTPWMEHCHSTYHAADSVIVINVHLGWNTVIQLIMLQIVLSSSLLCCITGVGLTNFSGLRARNKWMNITKQKLFLTLNWTEAHPKWSKNGFKTPWS